MHTRPRTAVTLIEWIVVAIVVLVLALTILPQLRSTADRDRRANADYFLADLRARIQAYRAEQGGAWPTYDEASRTLPGLLSKRPPAGSAAAPRSDSSEIPLFEFPANPFTDQREVRLTDKRLLDLTDVSPDQTGGWLYNPRTGQIFLDSAPGFEK